MRDSHRGNSSERGYDAHWRRVRAMFLARNPLCEECRRPATDVHHRLAKRLGGTNEWRNLEALCHACHSRKTIRGE